MAVVVLIDAYCTCWDIDARAEGKRAGLVAQTISDVCLALYTLELAMFFLVSGWVLLKDWVVQVDIAVVVCGFVEIILSDVVDGMFESVGLLRILRIMRIIRLSRLLRKTRTLRELQKLVRMMATCLKALMWSFVFCFMVMTVWAMLIVEWVYPRVQSLHDNEGLFEDCEQCVRATSSVMNANLLLFKTVIAGDSWGLIAVPVIEHYPATALLFMGSLLTLVFGVLNLIVAVVVDNFAETRQRDVLNLAEEMEDNLDKDTKLLEAIFQRIDEDGSGQVTFEELVEGARKDKEFQSRLRVMDIDEADLQQLFEMCDTTGEGSIEASQFIAPMTRWVHDSKTAARFNKYNTIRTLHAQEEFFTVTQEYLDNLSCRMDCIAQKLGLDVFSEEAYTSSFGVGGSRWTPTRQASPFSRQTSPYARLSPRHTTLGSQGSQSPRGPSSPQRSWNLGPSGMRFGPNRIPTSKEFSDEALTEEREDQMDQSTSKQEETEGVEQPHSSTQMSFPKIEALELKAEEDKSLKVAMQKVEALVVDATRSAVKASLGAVEKALQDRPRGGDDKDNMTTLLQMFEGLHHPPFLLHPHPYPRPYPHGLQRRGTDETSLLSARRGKEPDFTSQLSSKRNSQAAQESRYSYRRNSTTFTSSSDHPLPPWLRPMRRSQNSASPVTGPGSGRPLIGGFSPPGTASLQLAQRSAFRKDSQKDSLPRSLGDSQKDFADVG
ncbi:unnamed protein product [Cladocopium goreaui]|uniref:EF-hand domain-containing protein n=1 Tax=Cladocopium goreaui TaxID=2562237 RepID=A0A9P1FVY0_9DINO|nr:unnamed protein product [Cladocopium goreaui]